MWRHHAVKIRLRKIPKVSTLYILTVFEPIPKNCPQAKEMNAWWGYARFILPDDCDIFKAHTRDRGYNLIFWRRTQFETLLCLKARSEVNICGHRQPKRVDLPSSSKTTRRAKRNIKRMSYEADHIRNSWEWFDSNLNRRPSNKEKPCCPETSPSMIGSYCSPCVAWSMR